MHSFFARLNRRLFLNSALIVTFGAMLSTSIYYQRGIEHARYILLGLAAWYFARERESFRELITSAPFSALIAFLGVAIAGLTLNGHPLSNVDEILNWILTFSAGYLTARLLGKHRSLLLMVLPVTLVCAYIVYPLLFGPGLAHLDPASPIRLEWYFRERPNHLGVICGAAAFTSACFAMLPHRLPFRVIILLSSGVCLFLLFKTGARASFIATIAIYGIAVFRRFRHSWKTLSITVLLLGAGLMLFTGTSALQNSRIATLAQGIRHDKSFQQRMLTWTVAGENFRSRPLLGNGFDTFDRQYSAGMLRHAAQDNFHEEFPHTIQSTNNAHNFFLHFLAETGILGLLAMLWFWGAVIRIGVRSRDMTAIAVSGMFAIAFIAFQLNMSLYGSQISTMLFGFAGISASISTKDSTNR